MSQLTRWLSLDFKNEIIIYTHIGDNWMIESDANGWETYSELPTQRFQHQYFDDTNLIKNMVFDLDVPTIGASPAPASTGIPPCCATLPCAPRTPRWRCPTPRGAWCPATAWA